MAVTALIYSKIFNAVFNKEVDILDDTIKVILCTSTYSPDQDTHDYYNDITNELSTGSGYTSGGATLANDTFTYTAGSNLWTYDGDDTSWSTATLTARYSPVYDSSPGTAATDPLIMYENFGADVTSTGGTYLITWNASGLWTLTVS